MIHALPGMGADRRMYPAPWSTLPHFIAHNWMPYSGEKSITEVAKSMCEVADIQDGDTLIGSSLGGMVACEITKLRKIPCLYLIGSATHKQEVNALFSSIYPLARVTPIEWLRFSAGNIPSELAQMFGESQASFVRSMCLAIFEWDGLGASKTRVYRIHGKHDRVIPYPSKVDLLLDGGHLISMSHACDCVEFIKNHTSAPSQ